VGRAPPIGLVLQGNRTPIGVLLDQRKIAVTAPARAVRLPSLPHEASHEAPSLSMIYGIAHGAGKFGQGVGLGDDLGLRPQ
jgi:hypothetical protein